MSNKKKQPVGEKLAQTVKAFDIFGESVAFEYDGKSTYRSYLGSLLSIGIIVITLSYAVKRFIVMQDRADTVHL